MTAPSVPTETGTAPSASEFEQDIGEFFGDYSGSGESPEPASSAAGTTPAEPETGAADGTTPAPASEEGADAAAQPSEGTPPVAAESAAEDDPFKDTSPATYVVNGQTLTSEDIRVFKEGGAVIRPESLPNVLSKLAERDQLSDRIRARDTEYQTLAKATEWKDEASGKTYTGPEAAVELRIGNAALLAENTLIVDTILRAPDLQSLLTTTKVMGEDGVVREAVVFRPDVVQSLVDKAQLQRERADLSIRRHFAGVFAESLKPAPAPIDFPKAADGLITQLAQQARLDASVLTPADRTMLAKQLPFHVKDGHASLEWQELVKDRMQDRTAQKTAVQTVASTTADATRKAQANMAAAARGVKSTARPVAPVRPAAPQTERTQNEGDLYDAMERAGAAALRASR